MGSITVDELVVVQERLDSVLSPWGFECHPFKVGWYNEQVSKPFLISYPYDTLAFVVISTPSMFEKAFIRFVIDAECVGTSRDPLDQCMVQHFNNIKKEFSNLNIKTIHDFEVSPSRQPRVLVQTAGHMSGAVRYYQRSDVKTDHWHPEKKVFGVCLHPEYGGWFALRGVAIFTSLTCPDLTRKLPRDVLQSEDAIVDLLDRYNNHWQDWSFRDVIPVKEKYSQEQRDYFSTKPANRQTVIQKYCNLHKNDYRV